MNCTPPQHVTGCLTTIRTTLDLYFPSGVEVPRRPLLVCYPNSGECWDSKTGLWSDPPLPPSVAVTAPAPAPAAAPSTNPNTATVTAAPPLTAAATTTTTPTPAPTPTRLLDQWKQWIVDWQSAGGAQMIGGCCRTDWRHISLIRRATEAQTAQTAAAQTK